MLFSACTGLPAVVSSTSLGCPGGPEKSRSRYCTTFAVSNTFSLDVDKQASWTQANYWLAEERKAGSDQGFILYLGCNKTVVGVMLRNTHDAERRNSGTKRFQVLGSLSEDGPWKELLEESLEDSRQQDPPPVQQFLFANSAVVSFIKFIMLDYWGEGGGLQYFAVNATTGQT